MRSRRIGLWWLVGVGIVLLVVAGVVGRSLFGGEPGLQDSRYEAGTQVLPSNGPVAGAGDQVVTDDETDEVDEVELLGVDRRDARAVALKAVELMTTWDPATEDSVTVSTQRASVLFTEQLAASMDYSIRNPMQGVWLQMAEVGAVSVPALRFQEEAEHMHEYDTQRVAEDGHVHALEALTVLAKWTWHGPGFEQEHDETRMFYVGLEQNREGLWEIYSFTYTDVPTRYLEVAFE